MAAGILLASASPVFAEVRSPEEEAKIRAFILRGKEFYRIKDYQSAIKTWVKVLDIDPLHEEAMELIDDAKFQSDYQVAVLDKLEQDRRLKKPYADELTKMADEMNALLKRAEAEKGARKDAKVSAVSNADAASHLKEQTAAIQETFDRGLSFFLAGLKKEAYNEWDKILPLLPESHNLVSRIRELKDDAHNIQPDAPSVATLPVAPASEPVTQAASPAPVVSGSKAKKTVDAPKQKVVSAVRPQPVQAPVASVPPADSPKAAPAGAKPLASAKLLPPVTPAASAPRTPLPSRGIMGWLMCGVFGVLAIAALFWFGKRGPRGKRAAAKKLLASAQKAPMRADTPANKEQFEPKVLGDLLKPNNRGERDLLKP